MTIDPSGQIRKEGGIELVGKFDTFNDQSIKVHLNREANNPLESIYIAGTLIKQSVIYKIAKKAESTRRYLEDVTKVNCPGNECFHCLTPQGLLFLGHSTQSSASLSVKRLPTDPTKPIDLEKNFSAPNYRIPKRVFCKHVFDRDEKYIRDKVEVFIYYGAGFNYLLSIDLSTDEVKTQKYFMPLNRSINFNL